MESCVPVSIILPQAKGASFAMVLVRYGFIDFAVCSES